MKRTLEYQVRELNCEHAPPFSRGDLIQYNGYLYLVVTKTFNGHCIVCEPVGLDVEPVVIDTSCPEMMKSVYLVIDKAKRVTYSVGGADAASPTSHYLHFGEDTRVFVGNNKDEFNAFCDQIEKIRKEVNGL